MQHFSADREEVLLKRIETTAEEIDGIIQQLQSLKQRLLLVLACISHDREINDLL